MSKPDAAEEGAAESKCCFCLPNPFSQGPNMSLKQLETQMWRDTLVGCFFFILCEAVSAAMVPFWRPIYYSIGWIILTLIIVYFGHLGIAYKSAMFLTVFNILLIMFACINISHTMTMRSEHVHTCALNQDSFKDCASQTSLQTCLATNSCLQEDILKTSCKAPGSKHCADLDNTIALFGFVMLVSFLAYAVPVFWGMLLFVRREMTVPITPDDMDGDVFADCFPKDKSEEKVGLMDSEAGGASGSGTGGSAGSGNGMYAAYGSEGTYKWV